MSYEKLNLINGEKFSAEHVSHIEDGIIQNALDNDAVKTQVNQIKGDLGELQNDFYQYKLLQITNRGFIAKEDGHIESNSDFTYSDYVKVEDLKTDNVTIYFHPFVGTFSFYDENKNFISAIVGDAIGVKTINIDIPNNAIYVRVSTDLRYECNASIKNGVLNDLEGIHNDLKNELGYTNNILKVGDDTSGLTIACGKTSVYICDKNISPKCRSEITFVNKDANTGKIFVLDDNNIVLDIINYTSIVGQNTIKYNKIYDTKTHYGFYGFNIWFNIQSELPNYNGDVFNNSGIVEGTATQIGNAMSINVASSQKTYFNILIKEVFDGVKFEEIHKVVDTFTTSYSLDNGISLRYQEINEEVGFVGRWFDYNGHKCTNNDGAELYLKTKGATTLNIDFREITEQDITPYIAYSIDFADFVRMQISTKTISLPDNGEHIIRIVVDGMKEKEPNSMGKWNNTIGVYLNSVSVNSGTVKGLYPTNKVGMFFGDSITEGINALGTGANANVNSAVNSFPFHCCKKLNSVSHRVGYGGTGMISISSFKACIDAIDYLHDGLETPTTYIDFIVICHGTNDTTYTIDAFKTAYQNVINRLHIKYPSAPIIMLTPFAESRSKFDATIKELTEENTGCYFINTRNYGGATVDGIHLSVEGAKVNGEKLADDILKILGKSFFI